MSTFDTLVEQVITQNAEYPTLRTVIEKELLHYDILRAMNGAGFLKNLTFMGGTCLRDCYGSVRLSEDLDKIANTCGQNTSSFPTTAWRKKATTVQTPAFSTRRFCPNTFRQLSAAVCGVVTVNAEGKAQS